MTLPKHTIITQSHYPRHIEQQQQHETTAILVRQITASVGVVTSSFMLRTIILCVWLTGINDNVFAAVPKHAK